ncbi:HK97 gp10 family phage protein [Tengunoibacter tsumagoiensis]|uniref:HK97 gp10 family phage protein n=1 Tax=Tengunoibacter tsumagoiensis TaxID=2014871 RepID=A0A402A557_9CHLR|nr:HK97 gp10 family phage protein [Tengunoibacter tsumagoiensis]GCE14199.1 hypothetical protein KTT_40580 [Tengunoibacter tsumagoiensis]GCE14253.1 hypothetical protein KTT_41120 [Tengunoibacter tsumagoiensis]
MAGFSMSFDPRSLAQIAQFAGFGVYMSEEVQAALSESGDILVGAVRGNMHWQNPSGRLEASIRKVNDSPYELEIGSDLPYARRREFGFSGMVDRLGRYYHFDPGAYYFAAAANQEHDHVFGLVEDAVERALNRLGA